MRSLTKFIVLPLVFAAGLSLQSVKGQSILNPADPVITYDSTHKPVKPVWGQIGKWVRTPMVPWNTDAFKAYVYEDMPFRLRFPQTYNPTANDGKKYPMMVFFHGLGEAGPIYDNEYQLKLGHQFFSWSDSTGRFDGYILSIQSPGGFGMIEFTKLKEIIDYMVVNNKLDGFHVVTNGLSAGGQGTWEFMINYPNYICAALPMSWSSILYKDSSVVNKVKYSPIWMFQGDLDGSPAPSTTYQVRDAINLGAGGNFRLTEYSWAAHDTWDPAWNDQDFFPFINRAYASNPWPAFGKSQFWPGDSINLTLGLAPGYDAYQWRKDSLIIAGADFNTLSVTQLGLYDARLKRNGVWSDWSHVPVNVKLKAAAVTIPAKIEAEKWADMFGVLTENTIDVGGGQDVGWIDNGDWINYNIKAPAAGNYTINFRLASPNDNAQFVIQNDSGIVLKTVNVPLTGDWQKWQTLPVNLTLPAGNQTLRLVSTGGGGWNINWLQFLQASQAPANKPPVASAGPNQTISLPANSTSLNGSAIDSDGTIASYGWVVVSGPTGSTFSSATVPNPTVSNLVAGTYIFRLTATDNLGATGTSDVSVTVTSAPPTYAGIHIEAENYSAMSGVQTENTTDAGGGQDVGWIDYGDWMDFAVNIPAAASYTMNFRIATPNLNAKFQVRKSNGTILATVGFPKTGGYQTWQTISSVVNLDTGMQTIRIVSLGDPVNINWLEFVQGGAIVNQLPVANAGSDQTVFLPTSSIQLSGSGTDPDGTIAGYRWSLVSGPAGSSISDTTVASPAIAGLVAGVYTFRLKVIDNLGGTATDDMVVTVNDATTPVTNPHIEAENFSGMSGVQTENTIDTGGGLDVGWIDYGDWMDYSLNLTNGGSYTVNFRVATPNTNAQFQVRKSDGTVLATINITRTGGYQTWQTISATIPLVAGQQTLRLVSTGGGGWNINWMDFISTASPVTTVLSNGLRQIAQETEPALGVYPNPVQDGFMLKINNPYNGNMKVQIINLSGGVQREYNFNKSSRLSQNYVSVSNLPRGQYIIRIQMEGWNESKTIVKF